MEKQMCDFLVLVGNGMNESVESFKLFGINEDPSVVNEAVLYNSLYARDVNVRLGGGNRLLNEILGRPNVIGGLDLDKKRRVLVGEDLRFLVKDGRPSLWLAFPSSFDMLPHSLKDSMLGSYLKLFYLSRKNLEEQRKMMEQANYSESEIRDKITQSQTLNMDFITNQMKMMNEAQKQGIQQNEGRGKKEESDEFLEPKY